MFRKEIEDEIISRIKISKFPFIIICEDVISYDQYYNHLCKKIRLNYNREDINDTLNQSIKLYNAQIDERKVIAINDGTNQIKWQKHTDPKIFTINLTKEIK